MQWGIRESGRRDWVLRIIWANFVIFLLWHIPGEDWQSWMMQNFLVSGEALQSGRGWTLITSVFSHFAFLHLFLNMIVFWSFGRVLAIYLGEARFLRFYLFSGIAASLSHVLVSAFLLGDPALPALGASGAISAVILVFALLFPRERILLFGLVPAPALLGALFVVALDLWGLVGQARGMGLPIGYGAHLGGAAFGLIYYWLWLKPRRNSREPDWRERAA